MNLHKDKEKFVEAVIATSAVTGFDPALIEKDYFLTLFLQKAFERIEGLVFKGGTSLSKCYKLIDRFSEDIDLALDDEHFTQSKKRGSIKELISISDELELELLNREAVETHTHGKYNCFYMAYPSLFNSDKIRTELKIEIVYFQKAYPNEKKAVSSYIGEFFKSKGNDRVIQEYGLNNFYVKTQSLERALIDKVFALCDYYLANNPNRNSRHIYDISKLLAQIDILNPEMKELVKSVREARKAHKICLSAHDGISVPKLLEEILSSSFYKVDYCSSTLKLINEPLGYEEAVSSLNRLIDSGLFEQ